VTLPGADQVRLQLDQKFHLKDPTSSELGASIVGTSILMIDEMGYEAFTFRKLADRIGTTEASVYRYFKNKHRLLVYLIAWYWSWMECRLMLAESSKAYLHRDVTGENRDGLFLGYKRLCRVVADIIRVVSPTYAYPVALVSTVVESSHLQRYFAEHLPRLTDVDPARTDGSTAEFLTELVFRTIAAGDVRRD
jgi:AcrR family transcriptional regulator